ncbi:MAG: DNA mismatch repair protein MutS [Spirochaetales bacterium]
MAEITPMMRQYLEIKDKHLDKILFFRLGDFYEMFRDDAREASALLNLTLTHRQDEPMCGIPYHSAASYIRRLLEAGRSIAICEQVSTPGEGKGIVRREVVDILTPGSLVEDNYLGTSASNYTLAVHVGPSQGAVAVADLSTGEFQATAFSTVGWKDALARELQRFLPRELLVSAELVRDEPSFAALLVGFPQTVVTTLEPWRVEGQNGYRRLLEHFGVASLQAFSLHEESPEAVPAGALLDYWRRGNPGRSLGHLRHLTVFRPSDSLQLDADSARSLEITANARDGSKAFTLFEVLDRTCTAAGSRTLQSWLKFPLVETGPILWRQDRIESLVRDSTLLVRLRKLLSGILDLERLAARLALDKASPRDLVGLGTSLRRALELAAVLEQHPEGLLFLNDLTTSDREALEREAGSLARTLLADPAPQLGEGGLIQSGVSAELDELRNLRDNSQQVLESYLAEEQTVAGLPQLKLKHNRIIGYFFEISKAKLDNPPAHFQRRQSLLGTERYSTTRLRELEDRLQHAEERIFTLEKALFLDLRNGLKLQLPALGAVAALVAQVDVLASLAQVAQNGSWVRPLVESGSELLLEDARHPVVEASLPAAFVPNSVHFHPSDSLFLITGPNMAGKSTYLRQTALIVLLAQTGSFVPCSRAEVGLVDRIFCRVGASDHLAKGESTFLVEMQETARILRQATARSLVIMDEVGRGTGTRDGFSLAWAICEYLLETVRAKTLFATHFHELTALRHPALSNFSMAVEDDGREVVFLRKVVAGASDNSYGLHVARLAGVPGSVVDRATAILESLPPEQGLPGSQTARRVQLDLFAAEPQPDAVRDRLRELDPDNLTPLQALTFLAQLRETAFS